METYTADMDTWPGAMGTTPYDYTWALPCEKINFKAQAARLLPPVYSLVFILGLLGNMVVVVILIKYKRLSILTNIYLLNLAFSDLLFLFTLPFWAHYAMWGEWVLGSILCKMISGCYYLGLYGEIFFILLLTVDRYLAIVHAVFALRTRTVTFGLVTSIVTWGLAGLAAFPEFIFHDFQGTPSESICSHCYPEGQEERWKYFHALRMNILGLALPLSTMIICYSGIVRTLLRCPSKKKCKAIRLIVLITLVFFVFWAPYNLLLLLSVLQGVLWENSCEKSQQLDVALQVTEAIAHTHCCVNPVIYAFVGERFRKYLRHFFQKHVLSHVGNYIPFLPGEKLERSSSLSPSTGDLELSAVF
ncbi:C-C chemokine receptor type 3 [Perognathus longimembris pacificus]|uniref:C-C chemokine receptor type 3 n=1 Tax=Perognathus longimembris pacificus TaxID=214514 RepID=UPI002019DDB6|nr:C-C chemokine receptor type 3 [Perognathus longimembris pacificus]